MLREPKQELNTSLTPSGHSRVSKDTNLFLVG